MAFCDKILIVGFSGAGKTTLLKNLTGEFERVDDLDQLVFKAHGKGFKDLAQLIETEGWEKFRLWERQAIDGWLKEEGKGVLALGGGAFTPLLFELYSVSKKIKFCHLRVSFETALKRLKLDMVVRPLMQEGEAKFKSVFVERSKIYSVVSWVIDAEQAPEKVRAEFLKDAK